MRLAIVPQRFAALPPVVRFARDPEASGRDVPDAELRRLVKKWLTGARKRLSDAQIEEALRSGNAVLLSGDPAWAESWADVESAWQEKLRKLMRKTGAAELRSLVMDLRFDLDNPFATEYAGTQTAQLVTRVSAETKRAIRQIIGSGFIEHLPPREQARAIRPMLGLTERDTKAAQRHLQGLLDDTDLSPAQAIARAEKYEQRLLRRRAENIARTETLSAENAGHDAAWHTAQDAGLLPDNVRREWIATPAGKRTCDLCRPMHGQRVKLGEPFLFDGEPVARPPAHPSCRCTTALVTD